MFEPLAFYTLKLFGFTWLWGKKYADVTGNDVFGCGNWLLPVGLFVCFPFWMAVFTGVAFLVESFFKG